MARQKSIIKLEGTIGDITFLKTKDGYLAKGRTSMNGKRIASDPAFQRTRENNAEFGRAGIAGKVLRTALRSQLKKASDSRMVSRLTKEMIRVIQADSTSIRGARNIIDGEAELLTGFDFNVSGKLANTLLASFTAAIERSTGAAQVDILPFNPADAVVAPSGCTHFLLFAAGASIDFEASTYSAATAESELIEFGSHPIDTVHLQMQLPPDSPHPIFLILGIEFLQDVNGKKYSLKNGSFNAMAIVKVSGV